jgi:hypothetical protein
MSEEPIQPPELSSAAGDPGEHPLSVLLFSWMRGKLFYRCLMAGLAGLGALAAAARRRKR